MWLLKAGIWHSPALCLYVCQSCIRIALQVPGTILMGSGSVTFTVQVESQIHFFPKKTLFSLQVDYIPCFTKQVSYSVSVGTHLSTKLLLISTVTSLSKSFSHPTRRFLSLTTSEGVSHSCVFWPARLQNPFGSTSRIM